jgi:hypothetical protein
MQADAGQALFAYPVSSGLAVSRALTPALRGFRRAHSNVQVVFEAWKYSLIKCSSFLGI